METVKEKTPRFNYTPYAWEGKKYNPSLGIADIAKEIRVACKKMAPECKFSIRIQRYAGGQSMNLTLVSAPFEAFKKVDRNAEIRWKNFKTEEEFFENWQRLINSGHHQVNQYHFEDNYIMTEEAKKVMEFLIKLTNSYNFNDSDAQIDYFHNNFYSDFSVGSWDKPFVKTEKKGGK
ncbi:MAG: hypothetical protein KAT32_04935 [Candidatus Moranbacteria bacterium]|nr:hypothetical protein [Candidatus Moranbacteria bacterium]